MVFSLGCDPDLLENYRHEGEIIHEPMILDNNNSYFILFVSYVRLSDLCVCVFFFPFIKTASFYREIVSGINRDKIVPLSEMMKLRRGEAR